MDSPSRLPARISERFSNASLKTKLMVIIYTGILAIFLFLSVLMIALSYENNIERQKEQGQEFLGSGLNIVREEMQYISGIADYLRLARDIQSMMMASNAGRTPTESSYTLEAVSSLKYAVSIIVYDREGRVIDCSAIDGSSGPLDQPVDDEAHPLNRLMKKDKTFEWQYIGAQDGAFMEKDYSPKLCLWQRVQSSKDRSVIGALAISVDVRKLLDVGSHLGPAYRTMIIVNEKDEEVFNRSGRTLEKSDIALLNALNPTTENRATLGGKHYWAFIARVAGTDLRLVHLLPVWDVQWDISSFALYTIVAVALFMLLLIPLFLFITKSVVKPLGKLTDAMEGFSQGDFDLRLDFRYTDEVGRLGKVFNSMVRENKRLIDSNYVLKLKEKEAELASLQSQINPHFLYNVMNSIQWLAVKNRDAEVAELIFSLGKIFRFSLGTERKLSTVREEIELLYNYLKLQKQCYGNHFEYSVQVEEGVGEIFIPRLSIQPIVENSIVHGVEQSPGMVTISVRVYRPDDGESLQIEVADDGPGIPPERLALLPDGLKSCGEDGRRNHLALKNISERLRLTYGDRHSLTIESEPYVRTLIKIVVLAIQTVEPDGEGEKDV